MLKTFKTLNEQISILQSKGLIIDDINATKEILLRENYFFINGYRHLFLKSTTENNFIYGTNFREIHSLFKFDRQMRNIIFKNLLVIENNVKSIFSYQLSKMYGHKEANYLNADNFDTSPSKSRQLNDLLKKMRKQIRINSSQHSATSHYICNYGYIPMWIAVKVLSFGIVSELFTVMKPIDQLEIAKQFRLDTKTLALYLAILANFRNLCAHEDILYSHRFQREIPNNKYHKILGLVTENEEEMKGKNDLFALIIILKQMLLPDYFTLLMREITYDIELLSGHLKVIGIDKVLDVIGFPANFKEIARMK